ncbi:Protein kinase domain-containing protein [Aphelenchoides besseyi]|nr:Protein kinase domain-containing protein [Aphelenchoides besseyi]
MFDLHFGSRRIPHIWLLLIVLSMSVPVIFGAKCTEHTLYIMPLYVDTTVPTEFDNFYDFLTLCQTRAFQGDVNTVVRVLSLANSSEIVRCAAGDDCSEQFYNHTMRMNETDYERLYHIKGNNTPYDLLGFMKNSMKDLKCLESATLIIPTNIRCVQVTEYPFFWNMIGQLRNENIGCELDYLLKPAGSLLYILPTDKDGKYLIETLPLTYCKLPDMQAKGLKTVYVVVIVAICSFILILGLACIILCVLKVKYRYEVLKFDFLFRRGRKKEEELPVNNYYTVNGNVDKWELGLNELDIDYDNVLGSGAFAYVVQANLVSQRHIVNGVTGVTMFNGNVVAVKILHSTADEIIKKNFLREIDLMKSIDPHPHLLNLIGCVSNPDNPFLISELCEMGSLREILIKHRPHGLYEARPQCEQPEIVCLRAKDLTLLAWQISDALCYLAAHTFVHRDVAARNVFITQAITAKLGDFGLCHSVDPLNALHDTPHGKIPIKWTAIEGLKEHVFSEKSDVWSFGVLMFELYSGASMPYPTIEAEDLLHNLLIGIRLNIPEDTPEIIAQIMKSSWSANPEDRPTFDEIRTRLSGLLDVNSQAYGYLAFESQNELDENAPDDQPYDAPKADTVSTASTQKEESNSSDEETSKSQLERQDVHSRRSNSIAVR